MIAFNPIIMSLHPDGKEIIVKVVEVEESSIKVDVNHPLAAKISLFKFNLSKFFNFLIFVYIGFLIFV